MQAMCTRKTAFWRTAPEWSGAPSAGLDVSPDVDPSGDVTHADEHVVAVRDAGDAAGCIGWVRAPWPVALLGDNRPSNRREAREHMATIEKGRNLMTLVNVFTVSPDKQEELAALLVRATDETMRHLPGFISASIHRSIDGTKVVNYAQWRSPADFAALKDNLLARPHMQAAAALASFDPIVCEVVDSITTDQ